MQAYFYLNKSDERCINKEISQVGSVLDIIFKDDTDLLNPVISLHTDIDLSTEANYCWLEQTNRYYYITGATYSQGRYTLQLHVDVLMSHRKGILAESVITKRQAKRFSKYQADDKFDLYEYTNVRTVGFKDCGFNKNKQEFVLIVAGGTSNV